MRGWTEQFTIAAPAVGQSAIRTVSGDAWELIFSAEWALTTSAAVANRRAVMRIRNGDGATLCTAAPPTALVASTTTNIHMFLGMNVNLAAAGGDVSCDLPAVLVKPGWSVAFSAVNLDVGDQVSAVNGIVHRIPTGPTGYPLGPVAQSDLLATIGG